MRTLEEKREYNRRYLQVHHKELYERAKRSGYYNRPDVKARMKKYQAEYNKRPEVIIK